MSNWSETRIARALALQTFQRKNLVLVPNCNWTGYECDLLVVTPDLRIIDVEVKISRSDLKADAKKDKWWHHQFLGYGEEKVETRDGRMVSVRREAQYSNTARLWPPKVWKHYYAMPRALWDDALFECLPQGNSGVLLLSEQRNSATPLVVECQRRAAPNRDAAKISAASAVDIARLASLRMWEAYAERDVAREAAAKAEAVPA